MKEIIVVVEPVQPDEQVSIISNGQPISNPKSVHISANYIQLVKDLRKQTTAKVTLIEDIVQSAPSKGIIILYPRSLGLQFERILDTCEPEFRRGLPQRLVLFNIVRGEAYKILRQHSLAAIVEDFDYRYWWNIEQQGASRCRQAMYGLTVVAKEIEAVFRYEQEQYCYMSSEKNERLPAFLLRYLKTYVEMFPEILL